MESKCTKVRFPVQYSECLLLCFIWLSLCINCSWLILSQVQLTISPQSADLTVSPHQMMAQLFTFTHPTSKSHTDSAIYATLSCLLLHNKPPPFRAVSDLIKVFYLSSSALCLSLSAQAWQVRELPEQTHPAKNKVTTNVNPSLVGLTDTVKIVINNSLYFVKDIPICDS